MEKNVAGKWSVFAYGAPSHATLAGLPVTGDAANITANIRIDGGAANAVDDVNPTELEGGYYNFDVTAAESNGDQLLLAPVSATTNVIVIGVPGVLYTRPANFNDMAIAITTGLVGIDTIAAAAANQIADALLNRDMSVGTDSGSTTFRTPRQALRFLRNYWNVVGTTLTVRAEDDSTISWTGTVSTDAAADPATGVNPAGGA